MQPRSATDQSFHSPNHSRFGVPFASQTISQIKLAMSAACSLRANRRIREVTDGALRSARMRKHVGLRNRLSVAAITTNRRPPPALTRGRRTVQRPAAPVRRDWQPAVDALAGGWWEALRAAESALTRAADVLSPQEIAERRRCLGEERVATVRLLERLADGVHAHRGLIEWVAAPALTLRLLGLPTGVTACVFDLDGVLTTSAAVHAGAWAETFDPFLLHFAERSRLQFVPFDESDDYRRYVAGQPRLDGVRAFLASRGLRVPDGAEDDAPGLETVHGLANRKQQALERRLRREGVSPFAEARSYVEAVRLLGLRRAVVSASASTAAMLERAGLAHLIQERVDAQAAAAEHLAPEPAPDMIRAAVARLGVEPTEAAVFATTARGVRAARTAGARIVIGVDRDRDTEAERSLGEADIVVASLAELVNRV
jgi:beta-phosphoglucomutase-like phosphatase (HAD superfamily)